MNMLLHGAYQYISSIIAVHIILRLSFFLKSGTFCCYVLLYRMYVFFHLYNINFVRQISHQIDNMLYLIKSIIG